MSSVCYKLLIGKFQLPNRPYYRIEKVGNNTAWIRFNRNVEIPSGIPVHGTLANQEVRPVVAVEELNPFHMVFWEKNVENVLHSHEENEIEKNNNMKV